MVTTCFPFGLTFFVIPICSIAHTHTTITQANILVILFVPLARGVFAEVVRLTGWICTSNSFISIFSACMSFYAWSHCLSLSTDCHNRHRPCLAPVFRHTNSLNISILHQMRVESRKIYKNNRKIDKYNLPWQLPVHSSCPVLCWYVKIRRSGNKQIQFLRHSSKTNWNKIFVNVKKLYLLVSSLNRLSRNVLYERVNAQKSC